MGPEPLCGDELPDIRTTEVPGPRSRDLAARLNRVESPNITAISPAGPVFWAAARGAVIRDADGNRYLDLTAGFGVAMAGHANPRVADAIAAQAARLPHALGDVHPSDAKVTLLESLARLAPGDLGVTILGSAGAEAVEAALKTALLRTGRAGILSFVNGYHGLTYGALSATWRPDFREPFRDQLFAGVRFAPFPDAAEPASLEASLAAIDRILHVAEGGGHQIGAILVEPVQGRGGIVVPPPTFLAALRDRCDGRSRLLIADEIYTGFGRTGRWFACEHAAVVPDIMVIGKALGGGLPLSAAIGSPAVMDAWPPSKGEAIHTSTFLGNPTACAAALAQIREIEELGLVERARIVGTRIRARIEAWSGTIPGVQGARGLGLLQAAVLAPPTPASGASPAVAAANAALRRGVLVLAEGSRLEVLAITPPAVITDRQLDYALDAIEEALREDAA